jgi:Ca2+-binding EF-hand superfamily protein
MAKESALTSEYGATILLDFEELFQTFDRNRNGRLDLAEFSRTYPSAISDHGWAIR